MLSSIASYGEMIADRVHKGAYAEALRRVVRPGAIVLDIGTGPGILALLACKFGADRVYAIEPDDTIELAREIASANGYSQRIVFIQGLSTNTDLPERVDVIVSSIEGVLPLFEQSLPSIIDARERLLKPDGILIPHVETIWAAVVEAPELYRRVVAPWSDNPYGFDMRAANPLATNSFTKTRVKPEQLLTEPRCWATLDFAQVKDVNLHGEVTWVVGRPGTAHGLAMWFDATLVDGVCYSNAPGAPKELAPQLLSGNAFFPLSEPVSLDPGDTVRAKFWAALARRDYVWSWSTRVLGAGDSRKIKANFEQSEFLGMPLSPSKLRKHAANGTPTLNENGEIDAMVLSMMDAHTSLETIASRLRARLPARFPTLLEALTRVGDLSEKYSR